MADYYLIFKALHIIFLIAWMAGMLYLPRLYVYHVEAKKGGQLDVTLQLMEKRLLRYIMNPAMVLTLIFGLVLVYITGAGAPGTGGWFHAKAALLLLLFACHGLFAFYRKKFALGENKNSQKFYRILNEVPTILMIIIITLAVIKPF